METGQPKLINFPTYSETPYIELDNIEYRKYNVNSGAKPIVFPETGEVASIVYAGKSIYGYKDLNTYSKLFNSGKLEIAKLSSSGIKVLCYLLLTLTPNKEHVYIDAKEVANKMGYKSVKNVYDGIINLLQHGVIARKTSQSTYWINPNQFFNGDRTKLLDSETRSEYKEKLIANAKEVAKEFMAK